MCILIQEDVQIEIGALGKLLFLKGYYFYIGSAMGRSGSTTLLNRVKRHVSLSPRKKVHWHIDYLLESKITKIVRLCLIPSKQKLECVIAKELLDVSDGYIKNFGCSDCKCQSHLIYLKKIYNISNKCVK